MIGRAAGTTSAIALAGVRTTTGPVSSGSYRSTGSSSEIWSSSISIVTAAVVMGLVMEASRRIEFLAIQGAADRHGADDRDLAVVAASDQAHPRQEPIRLQRVPAGCRAGQLSMRLFVITCVRGLRQ